VKPKWVWIGIVVGLLGMSLAIHTALLIFSLNDPSFAVEPDYERKAAQWDETQRRLAASRALGWTVDLSTAPADQAGEVDVTLHLFDRYGKPVREADVTLQTFHVARAGQIVSGELEPVGDGVYGARLPLRRSGIWEFRLSVTHGDELYVDTIRKSVLSTPRSPAS